MRGLTLAVFCAALAACSGSPTGGSGSSSASGSGTSAGSSSTSAAASSSSSAAASGSSSAGSTSSSSGSTSGTSGSGSSSSGTSGSGSSSGSSGARCDPAVDAGSGVVFVNAWYDIPGFPDGGLIAVTAPAAPSLFAFSLELPDGGSQDLLGTQVSSATQVEIPDVPACATYWAQLDTTIWIHGSARRIDEGQLHPGLPGAGQYPANTALDITVSNVDTSAPASSMFLAVTTASFLQHSVALTHADGGLLIQPGASQVEFTTPLAGHPLIQSDAGDQLVLEELVSQGGGLRMQQVVSRAWRVPPTEFAAGTTTFLDGGFASGTSFGMTLDTSALTGFLADQPVPAALDPTMTFEIAASPNAEAYGLTGNNAILVFANVASTDQDLSALQAANAFPPSFGPLAYLTATARDEIPKDDGGTFGFNVTFTRTALASDVVGTGFGFQLSPPRSITVGGSAANTHVSGLGTRPTLAWNPPSSGTPTAYEVDINQMTAFGTGNTLFKLYVDGATHSIVLPTGVLTAGSTYFFVITALDASGDITAAPHEPALLRGSAAAATGFYTP